MKRTIRTLALGATIGAALLPNTVWADDYLITIKDNKFQPQELTIPADQKVKITVKNLDNTAAEFESSELNREKIVRANGEINLFIGPLPAGRYAFFDDFHRDTTTGTLVVK